MEELLAIAFKALFRLILVIPEMMLEFILPICAEVTLEKIKEDYPYLFIGLMILMTSCVIFAFVYLILM